MKNKLATLALIVLMPAISHALSFTSSSGLLLPSNIAYTDADNNFSQTQTFQYGIVAATGSFTGVFDIGGNFTFGAANYKSTSTAASGALAIAGALTAPSVNVTGQVGGATGAFTGAVDIAGQTTIGAAATKSTDTTTGDRYSYRDTYVGRNLDVTGIMTNGTLAAQKAVTLTASYIADIVNVESQTNPGAEYTLGAIYGKAGTKTGTDMTNLQLVGVLARAAMNSDVLDAYGLQSHLTIASGASSTGNMTAVSGKTVLADSVGAGIVTAGLFTLEGPTGSAVSPSTAYGIWADIVDVDVSAGIMVHANGSAVGSGLSFSKTGIGAFTKEITMQNGETIDNATDGTIAVTGALSMTGATKMAKKTIAELLAITPAVGDAYICSDCTVPYSIAIGTAASAGAFGLSTLSTLE